MAIDSIPFEDVMRECNLDDPAEFRRILKRNGLPVVSSGKLVDRATANAIVKRLQGRKINWYRYETLHRDAVEPGPLEQGEFETGIIENLYSRLVNDGTETHCQQDRIIGFVSEGGFLQGSGDPNFVLRLSDHINILIGDRGSGKSTALNLLGLLADSVSQEADVLVTKILNLLEKGEITEPAISKRVRKVLREYGIDKYAVFFVTGGALCAYLVSIPDKTFSLFRRERDEWKTIETTEEQPRPSVQVLQQGEVIAIADEKSRFFLHNILDRLYPDVHKCRTELATQVKHLITQQQYFRPSYISLQAPTLERFVKARLRELETLRNDLRARQISDRTTTILEKYVNEYVRINKNDLPVTLFELLQGPESSLYYLYLGRTRGFFLRTIREIQRLTKASSERLIHFLESKALEERDSTDYTYSEDGKTEMDGIEPDLDEPALLLESIEFQESTPETMEVLRNLREIVQFLTTRQRVFERWIRVYDGRRIRATEDYMALVHSYSELYRLRLELAQVQNSQCSALASKINDDEVQIEIKTKDYDATLAYHQRTLNSLSQIESKYRELFNATPRTNLKELIRSANEYDEFGLAILSRLEDPESLESIESEMLFVPIQVTLRQGNVLRDFEQLSFGQKSGIILKMVLETTDKPTILIDQPEDNLDATSIVNMLAPTLNRLGRNRQVVIATHNSHLVMGLQSPQIHVLNSLGETGRLRQSGEPLGTRELVREMLDVLEGGIGAFTYKLKMYEQFLSRVSGTIEDIDITLIESSFRRRTIDGLRNFLQPIVSDRSLMDFLRHELKQSDYSRIQDDIAELAKEVDASFENGSSGSACIEERLKRLCERLDSHITKLRSAIEEIRLLDTHPRKRWVNVHEILQELATEYRERLLGSRTIQFKFSDDLVDKRVYVDADHLRLVFRNLISNSLRATERRVVEDFLINGRPSVEETICIDVVKDSPPTLLTLRYSDNGLGVKEDLAPRLYVERCTDQRGSDHGLGGVIIRKLLDLSGGSIKLVSSIPYGAGKPCGTVQEITFPAAEDTTDQPQQPTLFSIKATTS